LSTLDEVFLLAHVLGAFWYVAGLVSVQIALIRAGQQADNLEARCDSFEEANHYQGMLLVPGAIAVASTGLFFWEQVDYNLFSTGWLLLLEFVYIITLLVCVPFVGMGLRRARIAALQSVRAGRTNADLEAAMSDNVPLFFAGIATLLVPVAAAISVFRPF
jgi:hypothetical protein